MNAPRASSFKNLEPTCNPNKNGYPNYLGQSTYVNNEWKHKLDETNMCIVKFSSKPEAPLSNKGWTNLH